MDNFKDMAGIELIMKSVETALDISLSEVVQGITEKLAEKLLPGETPKEESINSLKTAVWASCEKVSHKKVVAHEVVLIQELEKQISENPDSVPEYIKDMMKEVKEHISEEDIDFNLGKIDKEIKLTGNNGGEA